ncbi:MAG TPA: hypothetical protein VL995_20250 [Cellvibrio sp.]|nr:hypothetical protein [Cellvibrio sp.]
MTTASGDDGDDIVDFSSIAADHTVTLNGTRINGVDSVKQVVANNAFTFTLEAVSGTNTWHIYDFDGTGTVADGTNDGDVAGIQFVDFKILQGGTGIDTFTFDSAFSGTVSGGDNADIFVINSAVGTVNGNNGNDIFSFRTNNIGSANRIDGGSGVNQLLGRQQNSIWKMEGSNAGTVSVGSVAYVNQFSNISTINGGLSDDQLVAVNQANSWTISGTNEGKLASTDTPSNSINFIGIENLIGSEGVDIFTYTVDGDITGLIDGGTTATKNLISDSIDLLALVGDIEVEIGSQRESAINIINVEEIKAPAIPVNNTRTNTLYGASNTAYRWRITGQNQGVVEEVDNPLLSETSVRFSNFNDIRGGSNSDRFEVQGTITKNISGGGGIDLLDYSQRKESFDITLSGGGNIDNTNIESIEGIVGNSAAGGGYVSTIKVGSSGNEWEIGTTSSEFGDGTNDGSIRVGGVKVTFENFTNLEGGSGNDTFTYVANGQWFGSFIGGSGDNAINSSASTRNQEFILNGTELTAGTNLIGIGRVTGNAATQSWLIARGQANTWRIDSQGNGQLNNNFYFTNIANLSGGSHTDTFNILNRSWLTGSIDGGGGNGVDTVNLILSDGAIRVAVDELAAADIHLLNIETINANNSFSNTLIGQAGVNEWRINNSNSGTLNSTTFNGFANLVGGEADDTVVFDGSNASLSGHIDLAGGKDTLDLSSTNLDMTVQLNSSKSTLESGILSVNNIEVINGDAGQSNHFKADNLNNTWVFDDVNIGRVTTTEVGTTSFTGFQSITGGSRDDLFLFEALGSVSGLLDGGANVTVDTVDLSKSNSANVTIASNGDSAGFVGIERYVGNNIDSVLTAANVTNDWLLTGANRGTLNELIEFENFGVLKGGDRQDNFIIKNATISGAIESGDGDDTFDITSSAIAGKIMAGNGDDRFIFNVLSGAEGTADIDGGEGSNRLTLEGGDANYKASHQFGRQEYVSANNNTYSVLYSNIANVFDNVIANSLSIFGTATADTFRLQTARYNTNNLTSVNYTNKSNLIVNGSTDDQVIVDGTIGVESTVTFNNLRVLAENAGKIQARSLELVNTSNVGSTSARLGTVVNELSVNATNGSIYLDEQDGLVFKNFNVSTTDLVDIRLGGNMSAIGGLIYAGGLNIESLRGNIELGSGNSLTGLVNLKAAGNVNIDNLQALSLGEFAAQNATLNSGTSIKATGTFNVSGLATLNAGNEISLLNTGNDFNQINVGRAGNIELFDKNGFTSVGLNATNDINLRSVGAVIVGTSCTTDCATAVGVNARNLKIQSDATVTVTKNILAADSVAIESQGVVANDSITSKQFTINAGNGKLVLNEGGNLLGRESNSIQLNASTIEQRSTILSSGNVNVAAIGDITMLGNAITESLTGNVAINASNLQLGTVKASNGSAIMNVSGAITDNNGGVNNITAARWEAKAVNGIGTGLGSGSDADAIETEVGVLSVLNAGKAVSPASTATINIANKNTLTIEQLRNNGSIGISNTNGDIVLDNTNNNKFNLDDPDATTQGGVINTNVGIGNQLFLTIGGGMVRAENKANKENPDIVTEVGTFKFLSSNDFGQRNRKIVMRIPEAYNQDARLSFVYWNLKPKFITDLSKVPSDSIISGRDQLIQIEGLSEIDPAVFTNLRNYVHDEVAILLPVDQRFDEEEEF